MDKVNRVLIFSAVIAILAVIFFYPLLPRRIGGESENEGIRLFRDSGELQTYQYISRWVPENNVPYRDVFIDYPQAAALYLAWPMIFTHTLEQYEVLLISSNILGFLFLLILSRALLHAFGRSNTILFLLALPTTLYFTFYRYDVWPAVIVLASVYCLSQKKFNWSLFLLALAVCMKWYAIILFPLYWHWMRQREQNPKATRKQFLWLGVFSIVSIMLMLVAFGEGFFKTYQQHLLARGFEAGSIFYLLPVNDFLQSGARVFILLLQFLPAVLWVVFGKKFRQHWTSLNDLVAWSSLFVMVFVFFAKFYSPQWLLWFLPLLLLLPLSRRIVWILIFHDLLNFLQFPILYDSLGSESIWFQMIVVFRSVVLLYLIYSLIRFLIKKKGSSQQRFPSTLNI